MPRRPARPRSVRTASPAVEGLEARSLQAIAALIAAHAASTARPIAAMPALLPGPGAVPTPHELRRETFLARFQGPLTVGPGRFSDQARLLMMTGGGGANQFDHGNINVALAIPSDPAQPVRGTAALFAKNVATTGTVLILDLSAPPQADPGRSPTHFQWTVDGNSGGLYTGAQGQGTLDLILPAGGRLPPRGVSSGTAGVIVRGLVNTSGVGNILRFDD